MNKYFLTNGLEPFELLAATLPEDVSIVYFDGSEESFSVTSEFLSSLGLTFCCVPSYVFWREGKTITNPEGLSTDIEPAYTQLCIGHLEPPYSWEQILSTSVTIF